MYKAIGKLFIALGIISFILALLLFSFLKELLPKIHFYHVFLCLLIFFNLSAFLWFLLSDFRATLAALWFPVKSLPWIYSFKKYSEKLDLYMTRFLHKRLTKLFNKSVQQAAVKDADDRKYILFSDCHRGDNSLADSFVQNENIYFNALHYYYQNDYTHIEIGDGDELWENRFLTVARQHSNVFWLLDKFHKDNRFFMIWGNHDRDKIRHGIMHHYTDRTTNTLHPRMVGARVREAIVLKLKEGKKEINIFLVHGHQVDFFNAFYFQIGKLATFKIWKPLQQLGLSDTRSAAQNFTKRDSVDRRLIEWLQDKKDLIIIAGHNHHPSLKADPLEPYFNTGSCVHHRCITGIEIYKEKESWKAILVKWHITVENEEDMNQMDKKAEKRKTFKIQKAPAEYSNQNLVICRTELTTPVLLRNALRS
jgi:UDP-2,3-diacylglucosamine pyrophosphatase LpxH